MAELLGHEVKGVVPADGFEGAALLTADHGLGDELLGVQHGDEHGTLEAEQAGVMVVRVALDGNTLAVLDADEHATAGTAVTTYAFHPFLGLVGIVRLSQRGKTGTRSRGNGRRHGKAAQEFTTGSIHIFNLLLLICWYAPADYSSVLVLG